MSRPPATATKPPPEHPPAPPKSAGKGLVGTATTKNSQGGLPLPQERDQSTGAVATQPDPIIEQAAKDLAAGQVDTDMRATPGLDAARRERMVPTPPADAAAPHSRQGATPAPARPGRVRR